MSNGDGLDPKNIYKDMEEAKEERFEDEVVNTILSKLGLYGVKKLLLAESKARVGKYQLTLEGFLSLVRGFPALLGAKYIKHVTKRLSVTNALGSFDKLLLLDHWDALKDTYGLYAEGAKLGLIFNWPASFEHLIIHNGEPNRDVRGASIVWYGDKEQFCIETLPQFLASIDKSRLQTE